MVEGRIKTRMLNHLRAEIDSFIGLSGGVVSSLDSFIGLRGVVSSLETEQDRVIAIVCS